MARLRRTIGLRRFPVLTCVTAGLVGALGFVGVSAATSIITLDKPAQIGATAVRVDPPAPPPAQSPAQSPAPPPAPAPQVPAAHQATIDAAFTAINGVRAAAGLKPFQWNDLVALAAQQHSDDMAAHGAMSHTGSDGSDAGTRLQRVGFAWSAWAENVAAGFVDPVAVVSGWMASSGHRRHLLGDFTYVGVGIATSGQGTQYWTLDFAS